MFRRVLIFAGLALGMTAGLRAEETVRIDPAKAAQLQRLEPLTAAKVDVFVDSGQLTPAQADLVKRSIGAGGKLALPESVIGAEPARRLVAPPQFSRAPAPPPPQVSAGSARGPYASFNYDFSGDDRGRLAAAIRDYRFGNQPEIGRELRKFRPQVNELIAEAYLDPIDLPTKIKLWEEVAGPGNPDAAIGLFDTHRAAYELARPVLIPYAKDVGGVIVRRRRVEPGAGPMQRWMDSRSLRNMILDTEGLIARCQNSSAAIFLMGVYAQRYDEGEAPMRDKGRDRHRLVEACGGNPKKFDEDEPDTWKSELSAGERAAIADRLIPWIHHGNSDRKKIARNGLMICLKGGSHPDWDAGRDTWENWWKTHRDEMASR